jgi:hypothetical protein
MAVFAKKKGLTFAGPVYNTYLFDEISIADPERYLLQVSASVSEARRTSSRCRLRRGVKQLHPPAAKIFSCAS